MQLGIGAYTPSGFVSVEVGFAPHPDQVRIGGSPYGPTIPVSPSDVVASGDTLTIDKVGVQIAPGVTGDVHVAVHVTARQPNGHCNGTVEWSVLDSTGNGDRVSGSFANGIYIP